MTTVQVLKDFREQQKLQREERKKQREEQEKL